jgi:tetratricopeptide (TPR) repeat protein
MRTTRGKRGNNYQPARPQLWKVLLLIVIAVVSYSSTLNGGYIWDDDRYVTDNRNLTSVDGLVRVWTQPLTSPQYYPLVFTTFWLERQAWGLNPFGYHLVNVLLHASVASLLYYLLLYLEVSGAWLAALVFAVHPVTVETTAWITERKNLLSGLFYMLSAILLLRFYGAGRRRARWLPDTHPLYYYTGFFLFVCALLSKTVTCTLPVALFIVLWWKRGRIALREVLSLAPFLAVGAGMGLLTAWLERTHVGAQGADWSLSLGDRFLLAGRDICFYTWKLLWPFNLSFNYEHWAVDAAIWWQYLYPLAVAFVLLLLWMFRGRIGRGPIAAALFFAVSLFPALGFFDVFPFRYSYVADHFQYLACIGPISLLTSAAVCYVSEYQQRRLRFYTVGAVLLICFLALNTWSLGHMYADAWTLWNDTLRNNPGSFLAHNNLGTILFKQGKEQEAKEHFAEAIRLCPAFENAHSNMGAVLTALGKFDEAIEQCNEELKINPRSPKAFLLRGIACTKLGNNEMAIKDYDRAAEINPESADVYYHRGVAYAKLGDNSHAVSDYDRAIKIDPGYAEAYYDRGTTYFMLGNYTQAISDYDRAIDINPKLSEAYSNRGLAYARTGNYKRAISDYDRAIETHSDNGSIYYNRAVAYVRLGQNSQAVEDLITAARLDCEDAKSSLRVMGISW